MKGFNKISFRRPTTEDLDDDNVMILDRTALEQERFQEDHIKGVRTMQTQIKNIETKLTETKQKLVADEGELARLRERRGRLYVENSEKHATQITKLDSAINQLRNFITNTPACITVLEEQLVTAKEKYAKEDHDRLLNEEKAVAASCKELSVELVEHLRIAVETNRKFVPVYRRYQNLCELTKVDVLGSHVCEPSMGLLEYLYGFLDGELNKGLHCRLAPSGGLPPL